MSWLRESAPIRVAILSFTILVLELSFIRQIPAEVQVISYFTNLVLMASFFGLGLGCILQDKRNLSWLFVVGLALVWAFIFFARGISFYQGAGSVHYWLNSEDASRDFATAVRLPLLPAAAMAFFVSAVPFVGLGQALARTMNLHGRLVAYSWDIAGSLAGTLAAVLVAYLGVPPWIWPPLLAAVWAGLFARGWVLRGAATIAGLLFLTFGSSQYEFRWSPYYYVQYRSDHEGLRVWVNSNFHQLAINFDVQEDSYRAMAEGTFVKFSLPYGQFRGFNEGRSPESVLILGAGTGNDIHVALKNGAKRITAVEIDPVIQKLGQEKSPVGAYDSDKVTVVLDDARHFIWNCRDKFDLVIFGTLDSTTLLSGHANLRLENYVYTRESLADVKKLLNPKGMVAAYYSVAKPWLYGRLYATFYDAFGPRTRMFTSPNPFLFNTVLMAAPDHPEFGDLPTTAAAYAEAIPSSDDWPFIYLEKPTISPIYLQVFGIVLLCLAGAFAALKWTHREPGFYANFLFLGLGFALVESAAIVRLMLLFGSTWVVNAVVFSGVLLTIFLGNLLTLKGKAPPLAVAFSGVLLGVAINYFFPLPLMFAMSGVPRAIVCALLIGLPVFFASICFSRLFAKQATTGFALGINLIGVMAGGLLEYSSMLIGMKGVWLIVFAVYALAWVSSLKKPAAVPAG